MWVLGQAQQLLLGLSLSLHHISPSLGLDYFFFLLLEIVVVDFLQHCWIWFFIKDLRGNKKKSLALTLTAIFKSYQHNDTYLGTNINDLSSTDFQSRSRSHGIKETGIFHPRIVTDLIFRRLGPHEVIFLYKLFQ